MRKLSLPFVLPVAAYVPGAMTPSWHPCSSFVASLQLLHGTVAVLAPIIAFIASFTFLLKGPS